MNINETSTKTRRSAQLSPKLGADDLWAKPLAERIALAKTNINVPRIIEEVELTPTPYGTFVPTRIYMVAQRSRVLSNEVKPSCTNILPITPIAEGHSSNRAELAQWCNNLAADVSRVLNPGPKGDIYWCTAENFGTSRTGPSKADFAVASGGRA